nr:uncharacterized protein C5orf34 homolog [Nerophis lumbriciformis]
MEAEGSFISSTMIMYEDESVDIHYENGAQLQLSPCGSEFMLVKGSVAINGHTLETPVRVRQRTRFTISAYKKFVIAALIFRNKYASQPYLPKELTAPGHKKPLRSINLEVLWPSLSSSEAAIGPESETIIKSEDKSTVLTLAASGEEFFVEYACRFSENRHQQPQNLDRDLECIQDNQQQRESSLTYLTAEYLQSPINDIQKVDQAGRKISCSPQMIIDEAKPEEKYQSVTVVQHHSCHRIAPSWCYPLSLARHHWTARVSILGDSEEDQTRSSKTGQILNRTDLAIEERRFLLPQALPLICPSPHLHSWKYPDPITQNQPDQNSLTELVKVLWHQGVTYRILDDDVPLIEVSLGDGSVIRSKGVLSLYFTHYKPQCRSTETNVKEVTYHINGLPPDIPGQLYSISSIVSRASSLLTRYKEAKKIRLIDTPSCFIQVEINFYMDMCIV